MIKTMSFNNITPKTNPVNNNQGTNFVMFDEGVIRYRF